MIRVEEWSLPEELKQNDEDDERDCTKNWRYNNYRRVVCTKSQNVIITKNNTPNSLVNK